VLGVVMGAVLGAALMLVGLAQAGRLMPDDPEALVALAQLLETEHRRIDLLIEREDIAGAIEALEDLRTQPWPDQEQGGEAAIQLRHDVYGRLLRLRLDHPHVDPQPAATLIAVADEGLGEDYVVLDPNPFTARLVALRGEILEGQGQDDAALEAYEQALEMNRTLLERELGSPEP
jgi:tetratricopeptide (TPR) repeat protein